MFTQLPDYRSATPNLWQGRTDTPHPERFFQKIKFIQDQNQLIDSNSSTIFLGFASDVGVLRNQGRPGAKYGPEEIKAQLSKLPCPNNKSYYDLGSVTCEEDNLESSQEQFAQIISFCHQNGHKTVALGGGHEIAWAHFQGLGPNYSKIGIINFDAHFDLRPYTAGDKGNSGTPFSQIAAYCDMHEKPFHYCCVGIQPFSNTPSLFDRAKELDVQYLSAEEVVHQSQARQIAFLDDFMLGVDHIYLSICLDVFAECFAPGVSAPQTMGISPWNALPLLKYIIQTDKVVAFDIAELSPPLDLAQKTARLAALITAELLNTN
jgi:formiminoglutamase